MEQVWEMKSSEWTADIGATFAGSKNNLCSGPISRCELLRLLFEKIVSQTGLVALYELFVHKLSIKEAAAATAVFGLRAHFGWSVATWPGGN